ncbi:MAG: serine/threonine-protein kinase [Gemmatimonadaceae bacterium]
MSDLRNRLQAVLGDAYRIEREITGGGMSRLFLATESSLEREVVIKLLPPETASEVSAARFQREVLVAARLQHPHILPVLSAGASDGLFFYIMPYVRGESLKNRLEKSGRFGVPEALRILREIADALALAHSRGIVHRDIKPANVLLQEGHAVLTDFGIARAVEASRVEASDDRLTETGVGIGTVGYMAPEQLAGERELDARADVYALAVVGYEMLAGKPPFTAATAQKLLAAHLMETAPSLDKCAPDVPQQICSAIAKGLSKSPDERYKTAAEFRDALELPLTTAFTAVQRRRPPRALVFAGIAFFLLSAVASGLLLRSRLARLDSNYVVVLPFNVRNAEATLREGMVDVVSEGLNGQGWVKSVPPSRYVRAWDASADEKTAGELGHRMGAALAIFGTVIGVGHDSITVSASILDVARSRPLGVRIARSGAKENLPRLAADLTRALLKELNKWKPLGAFPTTWLEGTSLPALQAFLVGEQFYRRSAWDSALAYYERAIDADSDFALAYRHAGLVVGWRRGSNDSTSLAYLRKAGRFNRGLPRRDSLLIRADSIRATLTAFETDTAYFGSVRTLFRTLRVARDSFPTDPEAWYALADAYFHYGDGPGLSVSEDSILAAFDRSIKLDSGFTPAYIHAIEIGLTRDGREAGLRYAHRYLSLEPTDEKADGIRALTTLLEGGAGSAATEAMLDTLSAYAIQTAWLIARRWPDSAETALTLLRLKMQGRHSASAFIADPGYQRVFTSRQLAYRGRVREAYELLGTNIGPLEAESFGLLANIGGIPDDTVSAVFARWLHDRSIWVGVALPWWAAHRDTTSLLAAQMRADSLFRAAKTPVERRNYSYRGSAVRAYLSLARGDKDAGARFQHLPDTLCLGCYLDRLARARLLDSLGLRAEAEVSLGERLHSLLTPTEVVIDDKRATIAEKLQRYAVAARWYSFVASAWATGDDGLRMRAIAAGKKVKQLGGDQKERIPIVSAR